MSFIYAQAVISFFLLLSAQAYVHHLMNLAGNGDGGYGYALTDKLASSSDGDGNAKA